MSQPEALGTASHLSFPPTSVADILKLKDKGRIEKGKDADLVIVNKKDLNIDMVVLVSD